MNPATLHHPDYRPADALDDQDRPTYEKLTPASHSFLEPRGEGLLFAFLCLLCSTILYVAVQLARFLS
jgi:hypothetical protein